MPIVIQIPPSCVYPANLGFFQGIGHCICSSFPFLCLFIVSPTRTPIPSLCIRYKVNCVFSPPPTKILLILMQMNRFLIRPTNPMKHPRRLQNFLRLPSPNLRNRRKHILQKVIRMPYQNPNRINRYRMSQQHGECQHDPR